jgi:hypothetical protein
MQKKKKKFKEEGIQNSIILLNYTLLFSFIFICNLRFELMTITFTVSALTNTPMRPHTN